jgi:hypothetical protein
MTTASAKSDGCRITTCDQTDHKHKSSQHGECKGRRTPAGRFVRIGHQVNPKSVFSPANRIRFDRRNVQRAEVNVSLRVSQLRHIRVSHAWREWRNGFGQA